MSRIQQMGKTRQLILLAITEYTARCGYPPSLREISKRVSRSNTVVRDHLIALRELEFVTFFDGKARTYALTDKALAMLGQG